jgi:hypothetical protein
MMHIALQQLIPLISQRLLIIMSFIKDKTNDFQQI